MPDKTFGEFFCAVCMELSAHYGWLEHANALIYSQGAPKLVDYIHTLWNEGQRVELAATLVDDRLSYPK